MEFAVHSSLTVKIRESENIEKYSDLTRELKKMCNMWVMVIPIVVGTLGMVLKGLEIDLEELKIRVRIKTSKIILLLN